MMSPENSAKYRLLQSQAEDVYSEWKRRCGVIDDFLMSLRQETIRRYYAKPTAKRKAKS